MIAHLIRTAMPGIQATLLVIGIVMFVMPADRMMIGLLYGFSLLLVGVVLVAAFDNIILVARLFLMFLVGAYPLGVKLLNERLYFSVYEFQTQTLDITLTMYALTLIALPACWIGWWAGARVRLSHSKPAREPARAYYVSVFYLCVALVLAFGYLIISASTGTILAGAYGSGTEGAPVIGSASALGGVALSVAFYCALKLGGKWYMAAVLAAAFYLLIWCQILRGLRQDVVGVVFSMVVLLLLVKTGRIEVKLRYILYVLPAIALLELWGLIRTGLAIYLSGAIDTSQMLDLGLGNAAAMSDVIYSGTLGPIATTFANTVYLVDQNAIDFLYGRSYLEFIPRTAPEFLYPERPLDYALIFPHYSLSSGGGFFELAEAYLNFGLAGAFLMPLLITFVISHFYFQLKRGAGLFYVFALSSLLCIWMRGAWYQTFAFYKSFIGAAMLFCLVHLVATILSTVFQRRPLPAA